MIRGYKGLLLGIGALGIFVVMGFDSYLIYGELGRGIGRSSYIALAYWILAVAIGGIFEDD